MVTEKKECHVEASGVTSGHVGGLLGRLRPEQMTAGRWVSRRLEGGCAAPGLGRVRAVVGGALGAPPAWAPWCVQRPLPSLPPQPSPPSGPSRSCVLGASADPLWHRTPGVGPPWAPPSMAPGSVFSSRRELFASHLRTGL